MTRRTDIREAMRLAIVGLPNIGSHVHVNRYRPLALADLPAVLIFSGESEVTEDDIDGLPAEVRWHLRTDILIADSGSAESLADTVLADLVYAVTTDADLNGGDIRTRFVGTGEIDIDPSLEKPALRLPVTFEVTYL